MGPGRMPGPDFSRVHPPAVWRESYDKEYRHRQPVRRNLGEAFAKHELEIGIKRLEALGLNVTFMPHALKGIEYVRNHPEERAADLLQALKDPESI